MKKIFIFDAYPAIREMLAEELAAEGNMIVAIGKPEFVRETVGDFRPDLLILDLYMQGGIRWELLEDLKNRYPSIPVLLFTGFHPQEMPGFNRADAWVQKSFIFDELKQKVKEILTGKERAGQPDFKNLAANESDGPLSKWTPSCCH
jgi:DNA-binding response OmpR family regulator